MAMVHLDEAGVVIQANRAACDLLGREPEEVLGQPLTSFTMAYDVPKTKAMLRLLTDRETRDCRLETRWKDKDGQPVWVELWLGTRSEAEGEPLHIFGLGVDISDRKQARQVLRESEQRYRGLFDSLPLGVLYQDSRGRILTANPAAEDILGLPEQLMLGRTPQDPVWRMVHRSGRELEEAEHPSDIALRTGLPVYGMVIGVYSPAEGGFRWLKVDSLPHFRSGESEPFQVVSIFADISARLKSQEELERHQNLLHDAGALAKIGGWELALETGETVWTDEVHRILQVDPDFQPTLDRGLSFFQPETRAVIQQTMDRAVNQGEDIDMVLSLRTARGNQRWVHVIGRPYRRDGRVYKLGGVIQDISEKKRAEDNLRHSERRFRSAVLEAPLPMMMHAEDGEVMEVNRVWTELTGYSKEDLPTFGQWARLAHGEDAPKVTEHVRSFFGLKLTPGVENRVRAKNGEELVWHFRSASLGKLPDGRRLMLSMANDVTARRRAEEAQKEMTAALEMAQKMAGLGHWSYDPASQTTQWSPGMFEILDRDPSQGVPSLREQQKIIHPDDWDLFMSEVRRLSRQGGAYDLILRVLFPDGCLHQINTQARSETNARGEIVRLFGIIQDITAAVEAQEEKNRLETQLLQAQKMEAIGTLAGGIAHDFNNILSAMVGYTGIAINESPPDSHLRDVLNSVLKAGARAGDLVKHILSFSRQAEVDIRPHKAVEIMEDALSLLRASLPATIRMDTALEAGEARIMADATQVGQVLMNLCTNAAHAMGGQDDGVLSVRLSRAALDRRRAKEVGAPGPGDYLCLSVSDTGQGMDRATLDRVFDPFFTTKAKGEGTGLGLSVVHGIVHKHGGGIRVSSRPGQGATFEVFLPLMDPEVEEDRHEDQATEIGGGDERILLVDDEEMILDVNRQVLKRLGYRVEATQSPQEALDMVAAAPGRYDLVITDYAMPYLTGYELSRRILEIDSRVLVVLSTGFSEKINEEQAIECGVSCFLLKPVLGSQLAETVRRLLDARDSDGGKPASAPPAPAPDPSQATVLFVDDEVTLFKAVKRSLRASGVTLLHASSGEAAVELYREFADEVDMVIMDIRMQGMGGKAAAEALLELDPAVRIVMSGGYGENDPAYRELRSRVYGFLDKPYTSEKMLEVIQQVLSAWPPPDAGLSRR